jgi:hypothetical protein
MIYIGSFLHLTNQEQTSEQERRHGEFSLLIEASSSDEAVYKFRGKIVAYRMSRDFFEGDCDIFFSQLLEFRNLPSKEPIMFNYHSCRGPGDALHQLLAPVRGDGLMPDRRLEREST